MQVARGLAYAHERGIIHRDIKPANIMVLTDGGVKLMDFGIARDQAFGDLTETGTGLGTPSYMSPEQILGDKLDYRSDMFSLGVVLYQMVCGRKPFIEDEHKSVMHKIRLEKYPPPRRLNPEIPRELERIMARCMMKRKEDRFKSTQDLVLALERFISKRVEMNYHARLVLFLRDQGVITTEEADAQLHPAVAGGYKTPSLPGPLAWAGFKRLMSVQAAIAGVMSIVLLFLHASQIGAPTPVQAAVLPPPPPPGFLKVVVEPWAEVYVDGKYTDTTPFSRALTIPEGEHRIELQIRSWKGDAQAHHQARLHLDVESGAGEKMKRVALAAGVMLLAATAQAKVALYTAKNGDTAESVAADYNGNRSLAPFIIEANGLHDAKLKARLEGADSDGVQVSRAQGRQPRSAGAEVSRRQTARAPFLATFSGMGQGQGKNDKLREGQELLIPFQHVHVAQAPESLQSVARSFYGDPSKAKLLGDYNFRSAPMLAKGEKLLVPIAHIRIRSVRLEPSKIKESAGVAPKAPVPTAEAKEAEEREAELAARVAQQLTQVESKYNAGSYQDVPSALDKMLTEEDPSEAQLAEIFRLKAFAYVALGLDELAVQAFREVLARKPDEKFDEATVSPKIRAAFDRAKQAPPAAE